jgi:hypothetical protein
MEEEGGPRWRGEGGGGVGRGAGRGGEVTISNAIFRKQATNFGWLLIFYPISLSTFMFQLCSARPMHLIDNHSRSVFRIQIRCFTTS